jgi:hypothetical protein
VALRGLPARQTSGGGAALSAGIDQARSGEAMTRKEIKLALKQMEDRGAYSLRLFLDNRTTVFAHEWFLENAEEREGQRTGEAEGEEDRDADRDSEGLLRVVVRGRHALIAISRIVVVEMVPFAL